MKFYANLIIKTLKRIIIRKKIALLIRTGNEKRRHRLDTALNVNVFITVPAEPVTEAPAEGTRESCCQEFREPFWQPE